MHSCETGFRDNRAVVAVAINISRTCDFMSVMTFCYLAARFPPARYVPSNGCRQTTGRTGLDRTKYLALAASETTEIHVTFNVEIKDETVNRLKEFRRLEVVIV